MIHCLPSLYEVLDSISLCPLTSLLVGLSGHQKDNEFVKGKQENKFLSTPIVMLWFYTDKVQKS